MFRTLEEIEAYYDGPTIECLICGRQLKALGNHVWDVHAIKPRAYKQRFGLPVKRGLIIKSSREHRADTARANHTGDNLKPWWGVQTQAFKDHSRMPTAYQRKHFSRNTLKHAPRYTPEELALFTPNITLKELSQRLGRGYAAVRAAAKRFGKTLKDGRC